MTIDMAAFKFVLAVGADCGKVALKGPSRHPYEAFACARPALPLVQYPREAFCLRQQAASPSRRGAALEHVSRGTLMDLA